MDRASPGRTLAAIGRGAARVPRAIGGALAGFWGRLSVHARRRLVAVLAAAAVLLAFFGLAVPNLPCQFPGGDSCPPTDDAESLVPADALAYLHANLDPEAEEYELATQIGERIPILSGQVADRVAAQLPGPEGEAPSFERDVRPWFGGEAAIAILAGDGRSPQRVVLFEVDDAEGATEFAESLTSGLPNSEEHAGVEIQVDQGVATAQTGGFLVIGKRDEVRAVIDTSTAAEGAESLADDALAGEAREQLPEHRFAEAYLSADGVEELVAGARGTLGSLTPLLAPGATRGAAASLTATEEDGLELAIRSILDPERANAAPGFFAAFPSFEPRLDEHLPAGTLAYLGIGEPRSTVGALLAQASAEAPGIAAGFRDLVDRLRVEGGVDVENDLLGALGGEAAFALEPKAGAGAALPFLEFVADEVDEERARRALAALQGPLAQAVNPGSAGQAPVFSDQDVAGVEAHSLAISPTVELTYAVFDGLAAIATDPEAIAQLAEGGGGLDEAELYRRATAGFDSRVSLIGFFDLAAMISLGEQLGLAEDPVYATFASEFRRLEGLGLAVSSDEDLLSTDARLLLGGEDPGGGEQPPQD